MVGVLVSLAVTIALILLGYFIGKAREARHFHELEDRERALNHITVVDIKSLPMGDGVRAGHLVMGEAVVAADYFKTFAASLRNLFGGEVRTYNTMLERARREARLRMVEEAHTMGADLVLNTRFETSSVGPQIPSAEVFCFGTAVVRAAR